MIRPLTILPLLGLLAACSGTEEAAEAPRQAAPAAPSEVEAALRELLPDLDPGPITRESLHAVLAWDPRDDLSQSIAAIRVGNLEQAHLLLERMLLEDSLAEGRELLLSGNARDALVALDDAAELAPRNDEVLILRGEAMLRIGLEDGSLDFLEDALENFRRAATGDDPRAYLGASRAAYQTSRFDEALEYAREGMASLDRVGKEPLLFETPERTWAQAALRTYITLQSVDEAERDTARAEEIFAETRSALSRLVGRAPTDPWARLRLADLYQWKGDMAAARTALEAGIELAPEEPTLHERLVQVLRAQGEGEGGAEAGREAVIEWYRGFREAQPDVAIGAWHLNLERFHGALEEMLGGADRRKTFADVEAGFRECREMEPNFYSACVGYELMCRNAIGWCAFNAGDLEGAREAFQSMDDLADRGMEWKYEGKLLSGVRGLEFIAAKHAETPDDLESQRQAARIYDFLRAYVPDNSDFHNNAGFFNRDTAVAIELEAQTRLRQLDGLSADEREAALAEIDRMFAEAREIMERSYDAYVDAARLAPNDVRIVNDTGLILAYYLQDRTEKAEEYLLEAIRLGEQQVAYADELEEAEREALIEAYGDAHQNLGVVYLTQRKAPEKARVHFEKSVEIGPFPRPVVVDRYLPNCDAALNGDTSATIEIWGRRP